MVTPFELSLALNTNTQWDGRYVLDFNSVLSEIKRDSIQSGTYRYRSHMSTRSAGLSGSIADEADSQDEDQPKFSLVSGTYRNVRHYGKPASGMITVSTAS